MDMGLSLALRNAQAGASPAVRRISIGAIQRPT